MASVHKREGARGTSWRVAYRLDGKQRVTTFETENAAQAWAALVDSVGPARALIVLNADAPTAPEEIRTVQDQVRRHVTTLTGISTGTRRTYESMADYALGRLTALPITTVTREDVAAWVNGMADKGLSGKTIRNRHGLVSAAFDSAIRDGKAVDNPFKGTRIPRTDHATTEMVFLEPAEFAQLHACITGQTNQALVMFLVGTGVRFGEATALTIGDVDLARGTARIRRAWKHTGKAARELGPTKTRRSNRTVRFGAQVGQAIRPLVEGRPPGSLVFTNTRGNPIGHASFHTHAWAPAVRRFAGDDIGRRMVGGRWVECTSKPGPGKRPRPHDLRHTFASWSIRAGIPLTVVQRQLGHESIVTTSDRYGHLAASDFDPMTDAINGQLQAAGGSVAPFAVVRGSVR